MKKNTPSDFKLRLGWLDLGLYWYYSQNSMERILETIKTAEKADKLGFTRYWVSEHHSKEVAWRGTDLILTLIAGHTFRIRVGSGGILLNYYNPFLVSENYKLLTNTFNQRIDLGLAQGRAATKQMDEILMGETTENSMDFLQKVEFLRSAFSEKTNPHFASPPYEGISPDLWVLGTSLRNFDFAIKRNLNYCLSICHKNVDAPQIDTMAKIIRNVYKNNDANNVPPISVMVSVICGKTQKHADKMAQRAFPFLNLSFCGDQNGCFNFLIETKEMFGISEIIVADVCGNQRDRISSLSLLSEIIN